MSEQPQTSKEAFRPVALPPELAGKTLPAPAIASSETVEAAGAAVTHEGQQRPMVADPGVAAAFGADLHGYVREYIALADQKAGVLFTLLASMLVFLHSQNATRRWIVDPRGWGPLEVIALAAVVGLLLGAAGALSVVVPRTRGASRGYVFWGAIAAHRNAQEYADRVATEDAQSLVRAKLEHCYELAAVCQRKYWFLDRAIWCGVIGLAAALAYVALS